jgi:hypothetical protein
LKERKNSGQREEYKQELLHTRKRREVKEIYDDSEEKIYELELGLRVKG